MGRAERPLVELGLRGAAPGAGSIDEAVQVIDMWEADAARVNREWVFGHVTRSRGLIAAAHGDVDRAASLLQRAVAQHEGVGDPYGRARALLALGVVQRRARQKRAAREAIQESVRGFEELGAATWVEKARGELGSIGGRTREAGLTAAERRVAALVAEGRTNREVAAALFLGERTVASHLTHIYAKLGIRSRTELARVAARVTEQSSDVLTFSRRNLRRSVEGVPSYLVETYLARGHAGERRRASGGRARQRTN